MIKLKSLLNEGYLWDSKSPLIGGLIKDMQPMIDDIVAAAERKAEEKGIRFTKFDREFIELTLRFDLLKSLGAYTKPGDKIVSKSVSKSHKGSLTIDAVIQRDGERYPFHTEVIYAGGHSIQVLHFRYLTHTKLPKSTSNPEADKVKAELQRLSKGQKIQKDIDTNGRRIQNLEAKTAELTAQTDDEALAADKYWNDDYSKLDWDEIVRRGADKNYKGRSEFETSKEEYRQSILGQRKRTIASYTDTIKSIKKDTAKLQSKLDALAN